jgi:sugar phosphate isomerase/epimerase
MSIILKQTTGENRFDRRRFIKAGLTTLAVGCAAPELLAAKSRGEMKFAICNEIFKDWKFEDVASFAAKAGYDGIEIAPFTLANSVVDISAAERKRLRKAADRNSIVIAGIHWVLVKPDGLYINHTDPAVRERTSQYLTDLVDFCADLGGTIMVVGSPKQRKVMPGVTYQQAWDWALETFRRPVKRAEERKVTVCLEPLAPAETDFINTAADGIRFVQTLGSPRFKIMLDVKAMCSESKPIPQIIAESWPHFAHFHANDKNLKGPGFGDVDFKPIAAALHQVGYAGWVSVEVFNFDEGPQQIATQSREYLRRTF